MHFRGKLKKRLHLINEPIVGLKDGVLISQGRKKTLAVLKNTSGQPIEVINQENKRVLARPI